MSKVAVIPLAKFTSEADHKLVSDLATSVEREAVVRFLVNRAAYWTGTPLFGYAVRKLLEAADDIKAGKHIP